MDPTPPLVVQELRPGRIDRHAVQVQDLEVFPQVVVVVYLQLLAFEEVHSGLLDVLASVHHLQEGSLRVALRTQDPVRSFNLYCVVNACLRKWAVKEDACVLQHIVDVFQKLFLGFPAVVANQLLDGSVWHLLLDLAVKVQGLWGSFGSRRRP